LIPPHVLWCAYHSSPPQAGLRFIDRPKIRINKLPTKFNFRKKICLVSFIGVYLLYNKNLKMTELELLEDTIKYYSENPERRCVVMRSCYYSPITAGKENISEGCAIGRHLDKDFALQIDNEDDDFGGCSQIENVLSIMLEKEENKSKFPDWMLKMKPNFLSDIQGLHDGVSHWDKNGLTQEGLEYVKEIKNKLANNLY